MGQIRGSGGFQESSNDNQEGLSRNQRGSIGQIRGSYTETANFQNGSRNKFTGITPNQNLGMSKMTIKTRFPKSPGRNSQYLNAIQCYESKSSFTKEFVVVNDAKVKFCLGIYRKFLDFDIEMFFNFLTTFKGLLANVVENKKMFYCSLCDAHSQRFFDHKRRLVIYEQEYCRSLILDRADYIKFMNVVFVEFADQLLQYVQCFETDGKIFSFPFQNMMHKYKQRIPFWNKCLAEASGKGFLTSCWSMCNKLSIQRISPLWDGDVKMLERVSIAILSFLRKFRIEQVHFRNRVGNSTQFNYTADSVFNIRAVNNVDGVLTEPLNPSLLISNKKIIGDINLRNWMLGKKTFNSTIDDFERKKLMVQKYLQYLDLGDLDKIRDLVSKPHRIKGIRLKKYNDTLYINSDRYNSTVNNLINQLYNLTAKNQIFSTDLPRRHLRQQAVEVIKRSGFDVDRRGRMLRLRTAAYSDSQIDARNNQHQNFSIDPRLSRNSVEYEDDDGFNNQNKTILNPPLGPLKPTIHKGINSLGFEVRHNYTSSLEQVEPIESSIPVENPSEFYVKNLKGIDVTHYGTTLESEGLNPWSHYSLAMFSYNVSKLIGMQFAQPEKIIAPVVEMYMKATPKFINKFNFDLDEKVMGFKEIIESYPDFKKLRRFEMVQKAFDMRKKVALNNAIENHKRQAITKLMADAHKNDMDDIKEREYKELLIAREHQKIEERERLETIHHVEHKHYKSMFEGIKEFFVSLFGA